MKQKLTTVQSSAVSIAVFFATVLVVMRHGFNLHRFYPGGNPWMPISDWAVRMEESISRFTDCAIPVFFAVSGFLFFLGISSYGDIFRKWKRRIRSLLIPFVLWNAGALLLWTSLSRIPCLHEQMVESFGVAMDWRWFLQKMTMYPVIGQFWYIRSLIVIVCLAPIFFFCYQYRILSICFFGLGMLYWEPIDRFLFTSEGMICFYLGGMIAYNNWHETFVFRKISWFLPVVIAGMILYFLASPARGTQWYLRIFLSMVWVIQVSLFCSERQAVSEKLLAIGKYSFFVYAFHVDILGAVSIFLGKFLPHLPVFCAVSYWFNVVFTIAVSLAAAKITKRFLPRCYGILTGGRG